MGTRLTQVGFAAPDASGNENQDILIVLFLRGGWDALNVVLPIAGDDRGNYEAARPELQIPLTSEGAALPLDDRFGFHPEMAPLLDLYQDRKLAVVHAVGLKHDTRSHFDAQQFIENGTPGIKSTTTGWITRHLESDPNLPESLPIPALAAGSSLPNSLLGSGTAVAMNRISDFSFYGNWKYKEAQRAALYNMYDGDTWLYQAGTHTLDAVGLIEDANLGDYVPDNGAVYPDNSFGDHLQLIAQLIKAELGIRTATLDRSGWDTHENEGSGSTGYLADQLADLAAGLSAFYMDMQGSGGADFTKKITIVVMSEFGRRFKENANRGTDHGHGGVMLLMGEYVNGGKVFGDWPGLAEEQLYDGRDLAITTDYRDVISEILINRLSNPNIDYVFPNFDDYQTLGIVRTEGYPDPAQNLTYLPILNQLALK